MQEMLVQFLHLEDPLKKGMATHSSILAWRISWKEEPGVLQSMGFSMQEYWSGLPCPSSGDLFDPGIKPESPALQANFLPASHQGYESSIRKEDCSRRQETWKLFLVLVISWSMRLAKCCKGPRPQCSHLSHGQIRLGDL